MSTLLTPAINGFTDALQREGEQVPHVDDDVSRSVESFRLACHAGEYRLRRHFATNPAHPIVQNPYVGVFDIFDLPREALVARPRDWNEPIASQFALDHEGRTYYFSHQYLLSVPPPLRRIPGTQCVVDDLSAFRTAWDIFSGGALSTIKNWDNIIIAGGSVLACLTTFPSNPSWEELFEIYQSFPYKNSDIDLFLWGMSEAQAKAKMQEIFVAVNSAVPWDVFCFRTKNTITIQAEYPKRPIQIIMRLYATPAEILCGFDVDCCCVAYNGTNVFTNPRGLNAIVRQCNRIDILRRSPSYEHRLAKYSSRGYEIYYPGLDRDKIDYPLMGDPDRSTFPRGLGRLIVYELIRLNYERFELLYETEYDLSEPIPVDRLRHSNYDYAWIKIPYGDKWWSPKKVKKCVEKMAAEIMGSMQAPPVHRHVMTCGTMAECLERCCNLPTMGNSASANEANGLFSGPVMFITDNPGRQTVGSFNPIDFCNWESDAYYHDYDATTRA